MDDVKSTVHSFILNEFLPGEDPSELTDSTPLDHRGDPGFDQHAEAGHVSGRALRGGGGSA